MYERHESRGTMLFQPQKLTMPFAWFPQLLSIPGHGINCQWVRSNFQPFFLPRLQSNEISRLWKQDGCASFSRCFEDLWSLLRLIFEAKMQSHLEATRNIWTLKPPLSSEPVCNSHQCLRYCMKGGVATHQCSYAFQVLGAGHIQENPGRSYRVV